MAGWLPRAKRAPRVDEGCRSLGCQEPVFPPSLPPSSGSEAESLQRGRMLEGIMLMETSLAFHSPTVLCSFIKCFVNFVFVILLEHQQERQPIMEENN